MVPQNDVDSIYNSQCGTNVAKQHTAPGSLVLNKNAFSEKFARVARNYFIHETSAVDTRT